MGIAIAPGCKFVVQVIVIDFFGLSPLRVPAGDVDAGQLPERGTSGQTVVLSHSIAEMLTCVMLRAS